ncbi:hypothetical protein PAXRUDRAFT_830464 [Paxillus rubicundulus Ve08.2h10]|uniref:Uncharacterized protein n=1 Tax=Paxillus rubicundulus Ve08.2h10 TaxID=930991 RepID=A0A0D0DKZ3_9AGAM|nr:hypothetical protein PAXRUDRAFT_830464 [Paxillus rubicundulus Ve08.2h10]
MSSQAVVVTKWPPTGTIRTGPSQGYSPTYTVSIQDACDDTLSSAICGPSVSRMKAKQSTPITS